MKKRVKRIVLVILSGGATLSGHVVWAQDGINAINQANTMVRSYFNVGVNLFYAVAAVFGVIGAVKVYKSILHGDREGGMAASAWFAGCIFTVITVTVIRAFFGL